MGGAVENASLDLRLVQFKPQVDRSRTSMFNAEGDKLADDGANVCERLRVEVLRPSEYGVPSLAGGTRYRLKPQLQWFH